MSAMTWSLPALVLGRAKTDPGAIALRRKDRGIWQAMGWATLAARIRALGAGLRAEGIGPGAVVAILAETGPDWLAADLAAQGIGAASFGLPPTDAADSIAALLRDSAAALVVVENEEQLDKVLEVRDACPALRRIAIMDMKGLRDFADPMCVSLDALASADPAPFDVAVAALPEDGIAALIATSGTSQAPRLAALTHANLQAQTEGTIAAIGLRAGDERLAFLPMSLGAERVFGTYAALVAGAISNFVESAETVPENLAEVRPTVMFAIPRVWQRLHASVSVAAAAATPLQRRLFHAAMGAGGFADRLVLKRVRETMGLDRLRLAFVGAAPASVELVRWFHQLGVPLRQAYGVAESGGLATLAPDGEAASERVGVPVGGVELRIDGEGEVLLRGPGIAASAWRDGAPAPALDAEGWFHTGDLGRLDGGALVLTGRRGEDVETHEGKVLSSAFEARIRLSPFIQDAMLVAAGRGLGCLVMLEWDAIEGWAQARNIQAGAGGNLARHEAILTLIGEELRRHAPETALAAFRIVERRIGPGDPEVTPTMRLRRHVVIEHHAGLIADMAAHA